MNHQPPPTERAGKVTGYQVGSQRFRRKEDLLAHVRHILHTTPLNAPVAEAHLAFLLDLLAHHPNAQAKAGVGVAAMQVRLNPKYRTNRCFWIIRFDGSETDWSFMRCISPMTTMKVLSTALH